MANAGDSLDMPISGMSSDPSYRLLIFINAQLSIADLVKRSDDHNTASSIQPS
jgi:hypothetical protein